MITLTNPGYRLISDHGFAEVRLNLTNNQKTLIALRPFRAGELFSMFSAKKIMREPNYLSFQIATHKHIMIDPEFLQCINHSCNPNTFFDTHAMRVITLRPIKRGEELTWFYPSAEWEMAQSFQCFCGSPNCLGEIKGAAYLAKSVLNQYKLTRFIQQQLHDRSNEERA
ncbi:MAG TPA: SET domain-containing protein-lysine N-methyltransferase [Chitinophagaceae bacterium]|jgi:hypothetical protein|nr:SET domain-containing protein-lysine N-methyltransferase [Chitinophagaceae bacterium]